jgi:hypothetical protein
VLPTRRRSSTKPSRPHAILALCTRRDLPTARLIAIPGGTGQSESFTSFVDSPPSGLDGLWRLMITLLAAWSVVVVLASVIWRRWHMLYDLLLAAAVAACASLAVGRVVVVASWPAVRTR